VGRRADGLEAPGFIDLAGPWDVCFCPRELAPEEALPHRVGPFDAVVPVPGYWQAAGLPAEGTAVYRKIFSLPSPNRQYSLYLAGADHWAEFWLNGAYAGAIEGIDAVFHHDVSELLRPGSNELMVFVTSKLPERPERKSDVKGAGLHWDCIPHRQGPVEDPLVPSAANAHYPSPAVATGGLTGPVGLIPHNGTLVRQWRVLTELESELRQGLVHVEMDIVHRELPDTAVPAQEDSAAAVPSAPGAGAPVLATATLRLVPGNFSGPSWESTHVLSLRPGSNRVRFSVTVNEPALWWPRGVGLPRLYVAELEVAAGGQPVPVVPARLWTGFRRIDWQEDWRLSINGQRLFLRGVNYMASVFHRTVDQAQIEADVGHILELNANAVRVFGHVAAPGFYELCDRHGILVFQDLPFQWGYSNTPEFIGRAQRAARAIVAAKGHHPCIYLWCVHSEPRYLDYNKLTAVVSRAVRDEDPTRPVVRNSVLALAGPEPPSVLDFDRFQHMAEDDHPNLSIAWYGWYWGPIEQVVHHRPRFVTEFGAQAVPETGALPEVLARRDPDEPVPPAADLAQAGFQLDVFERAAGVRPARWRELVQASQAHQARVMEYAVETWRLAQFQPVNGCFAFHLVSTYPSADWSLMDVGRQPKAAYWVLKDKFQPVLVLADLVDAAGQAVTLRLVAVNDLAEDVPWTAAAVAFVDAAGRVLEERVLNAPPGSVLGGQRVQTLGQVAFPKEAAAQAAEARASLQLAVDPFRVTSRQRYRLIEALRRVLAQPGR